MVFCIFFCSGDGQGPILFDICFIFGGVPHPLFFLKSFSDFFTRLSSDILHTCQNHVSLLLRMKFLMLYLISAILREPSVFFLIKLMLRIDLRQLFSKTYNTLVFSLVNVHILAVYIAMANVNA